MNNSELFVKVIETENGLEVNLQGDYDYRFADDGVDYAELKIAKESVDGTGANLRGAIQMDGVYPQASPEKIVTDFDADPSRTVVLCVTKCHNHIHLRIAVPDGTTVARKETRQWSSVVKRDSRRHFRVSIPTARIPAMMALASTMFRFANDMGEEPKAASTDPSNDE